MMRVLLVILLFQSFSGLTASVPSDKHWSWQPLENSRVPAANRHSNPIDAFIVAHLKTKGLALAPRADRRTLIRRLTFNLTGLPPSPEQTTSFLADTSADAYEKLVDQLLASPAYGEHWAQHWLDLARFAETDGFEHDKVRPNAWRYRDWVIKAFNDDLPYNRFVQLQIAGDQLHPDDLQAAIATGFLLAGQDMPDINLLSERRHMVLNEMTATIGSAFLGLTLGCAQCHKHKSDPISQEEFYQMRAFFESDLQLKEQKVGKVTARIMQAGKHIPTHVMTRGDFRRAGKMVQAAYPSVVNPAGVRPPKGQRRELAAWLTGTDNALALRVAANRLWQQHFGRPLATPEDFGTEGLPPTHPQLLDWLAAELPRRKWSLKAMHKLIVTSATWRQASRGPGGRFFRTSYSKVRRLIALLATALGVASVGFRSQSLRRGGAAELLMRGIPFADILLYGRWRGGRAAREYCRATRAARAVAWRRDRSISPHRSIERVLRERTRRARECLRDGREAGEA